MSLESRVNERLNLLGKKKKWLEEVLDVSPTTLWRKITGQTKLTYEETAKLAQALDTSSAYLMGETDDSTRREVISVFEDDKGKIHTELREAPRKQLWVPPHENIDRGLAETQNEVESNVTPYNASHMIRIKVLDKNYGICCGKGIDWGSEAIEYAEILDLPIPELAQRYGDGDLIGARADGNSMEPDIRDGDLIVFVPHEKEILYAGIMMVVTYNNKMMIRGVVMNNQKKITLKPLNKAEYSDIVVTPDDDFDVCGRVVKIFSMSNPRTVL